MSCLLALAAGLLLPPTAAGADNVIRTTSKVWVTALGPWRLTHNDLRGASAAFGRPTSVTRHHGMCQAWWRSKHLNIQFDTAPSCRGVNWFNTASTSWRTQQGLRVGDPTSHIKSVYPDASFGGRVWTILNSSPSLFTVEPHGGRIEGIHITF